MKFKDHISHYRLGAERFDDGAVSTALDAMLLLMFSFRHVDAQGRPRFAKGFIDTARAIARFTHSVKRASEQTLRYRYKLNMLHTKDWRERVFNDLGGMAAMMRFNRQTDIVVPIKRPRKDLSEKVLSGKVLSKEDIQHREHVKTCAKATAHPRIVRDPCKLDQEGLFRLPPMRRHVTVPLRNITTDYSYDARPLYRSKIFSSPIVVWPDEFIAFGEWEAEIEALAKQREEARLEFQRYSLANAMRRVRVHRWCHDIVREVELLPCANRSDAVYAPP